MSVHTYQLYFYLMAAEHYIISTYYNLLNQLPVSGHDFWVFLLLQTKL